MKYRVTVYPASIYLLKVTIETAEQDLTYAQRCRSGVFIVNFEYISHLVLVFLLLTSNM